MIFGRIREDLANFIQDSLKPAFGSSSPLLLSSITPANFCGTWVGLLKLPFELSIDFLAKLSETLF